MQYFTCSHLRYKIQAGFVYPENKGPLKFVPHSIPGTECGRWINVDVAEVDGDGRPDILEEGAAVLTAEKLQ